MERKCLHSQYVIPASAPIINQFTLSELIYFTPKIGVHSRHCNFDSSSCFVFKFTNA
jgi:hypothetical protein